MIKHLTSMKSALAGMYPAISRDSTESNVGRGGSSVAIISEKYRIHTMKVEHFFVLCMETRHKQSANVLQQSLRNVRNIKSLSSFVLSEHDSKMFVELSGAATDGDPKP